jgi:hypothetical protein
MISYYIFPRKTENASLVREMNCQALSLACMLSLALRLSSESSTSRFEATETTYFEGVEGSFFCRAAQNSQVLSFAQEPCPRPRPKSRSRFLNITRFQIDPFFLFFLTEKEELQLIN